MHKRRHYCFYDVPSYAIIEHLYMQCLINSIILADNAIPILSTLFKHDKGNNQIAIKYTTGKIKCFHVSLQIQFL